MKLWEDVLYLTEPDKWSPNAMYQATRIFASNLGVKKAERFYRLVLLPRVRDDIRKNKRLHFALYQSLKKSLYKPAAFFKGVLFPLCEVYDLQHNLGDFFLSPLPKILLNFLISVLQYSQCSVKLWTSDLQSLGACKLFLLVFVSFTKTWFFSLFGDLCAI